MSKTKLANIVNRPVKLHYDWIKHQIRVLNEKGQVLLVANADDCFDENGDRFDCAP